MSVLGGHRKKDRRFVELKDFYLAQNMHNGIVYGAPRTGKTFFVAHQLNDFMGMGFTCFINDIAKGFDILTKEPRSEILIFFSKDLTNIPGIRIFVPPGCKVEIKGFDYQLVEVDSYDTLFTHLKPDKLNILSFETFILHPVSLARFWALFAIELLYRSKGYELTLPIFGVIDQINHVFPSSALRMTGQAGAFQNIASNWFARFLMDSSGSGIKIVGTSHAIPQVKKSVRTSFQWKFFKTFAEDVSQAVSRIRPAQKTIQTLEIDQVYVTNDQNWGDVFGEIPNIDYDQAPVYYLGEKVKDPHWMLESVYKELVMTPAELKHLALLENNGPDSDFISLRWAIGGMKLAGMPHRAIARKLRISPGTVSYHLKQLQSNDSYKKYETN